MLLEILRNNWKNFPNKGEYLKNQNLKCCENQLNISENKIPMKFLALYRIDEITYDDKSPRKEALENAISSMRIKGINFVYIIKGDKKGVKFYYGVAKDYSVREEDSTLLEICDIGDQILRPSLQGNFRGSVVTKIESDEREEIVSSLDKFNRIKILEGVPGVNKDDENFQSVDRIIDVMLGDEFSIMLIAKPMQDSDIFELQKRIFNLYNYLAPYSKTSLQKSKSENKSKSNSVTQSLSFSNTDGVSKQNSASKSETNSSSSNSKSKGMSTSDSKGETHNKTIGYNLSTTDNNQFGNSEGVNISNEYFYKNIETWLKYIEEIILPRLDYGIGKGLFTTSIVILGNNVASLIKMENTLKSIYGSEVGNKMPLNAFEVNQIEKALIKNFQIPILYSNINDFEKNISMAVSQFYVDTNRVLLGNWMSSKEISLLASLPKKEVVGLALKEEVEFGLNINNDNNSNDNNNNNNLGYLVQSGSVLNGKNGLPNIPVYFNKEYYDKHIFVTGVTGGGKTTTCQKLLLSSESNFLVIEPAKTEYRVMCEKEFPDMLVFTLGNESGAPFRLNPFEFFEGESITSRVDMIKASMEAAFDMEAAIPQILEAAIYECYEDKGWDISTNKNYNCDDPFANGKYYFPTLGDLNLKIEKVVKDQNFDERLKNDYIGSIRARLKGLIVGSKGQMLNTQRSIDFVQLLDKKVVLELENIKNTSEKSLVMGFILSNLYEAIKVKYKKNGMKKIRHLTLIEEAHRLLSNFTPGDSLNKKQSVEMFTDLLAEVRKYGESLIIADQIPNKLTSEVLKNTNTKIVHKIFAQDDKEAIGNTMALNDEQKKYLSYLTTGRAIMTMPNLDKAIQVQIERTDQNDTERAPLEDKILRKRIIKYFSREYKRGILPGLELLDTEPNEEIVEVYLKFFTKNSRIIKLTEDIFNCNWNNKEIKIELEKIVKFVKLRYIALFLCFNMRNIDVSNITEEIIDEFESFLNKLIKNEKGYELFNILDSKLRGGK